MAATKAIGSEKAHAHKAGNKAKVMSASGAAKGEVTLPPVFHTEFRPDLIQRAFVAEQSWERQRYGSDVKAGFRTTAEYYGRRREYYRLTVNKGMSRLPRQKLAGGALGQVRRVPHSKGGHRAHPPKVERILAKKMNEKEWLLALKSAIAATTNISLVTGDNRKHVIKDVSLPLVVDKSFESIKKASEFAAAFEKLGLTGDITRAGDTKSKAGKARTGKIKERKSVLVVVSGDCDAMKSAKNLAGVDVIDAENLDVSLLAPGGHAGRLTVWTEGAIEMISK